MAINVGDADALGVSNASISEFYARHWTRPVALLEPDFFSWQFTQSPDDGGANHCVIAVDSSGDLMGAMGLNRRTFSLGGCRYLGGELTTWIVDPQHQGKGLGGHMVNYLQSTYGALWGFGISNMALPIYARSGFHYLHAIPRYVRVFDWEAVEPHARFEPLAKKLVRQWQSLPSVAFVEQSVSAEHEAIIVRLMDSQYNYGVRDSAHLKWRYDDHPLFQYHRRFITAAVDGGEGVLVTLREETTLPDLRILHVIDCYGDERDLPAAVSFIDDYARRNGFHVADFYCTTPRINRFFACSGWFSIMDDFYFQFPHLFHPLELREPPTTSLIYWSREACHEMTDLSRLYITKQDGDFDRPTLETYRRLSNKGASAEALP